MTMIAVTYGYARVSMTDDESKNLDTQLMILAEHGIRSDLVYSDVACGRNLQHPGWQELTRRNIGIVAIRENIDTREGSAAAKFFRRSMLVQGACQVDSASERIPAGAGPGSRQRKADGTPSGAGP